jgi:CRP/FNR family transcriptional regulator, cyclic AMP receptor protein
MAIPEPAILESIGLFRGLSPAALGEIGPRLHRRGYPAGSNVLTAEQPGEAVYIVLSGSVKVFVDEEDGSEVTFAFLGPGDSLGEMSLIDDAGRSASAVTLEESVLLWIDRATFQELLRCHPVLTYNLVRELSSRLRQANRRIQSLTSLNLAGRIARQLLTFADRYGQAADAEGGVLIPLPLNQRELAELVGSTRESVNRVLVSWKRQGTISVDSRHRITVRQAAALARLCGGSHL